MRLLVTGGAGYVGSVVVTTVEAGHQVTVATAGMHGTDYPTPDGTAVRDYIHVADLADEHPRRAGDPPRLVASATRAADWPGWKPDKPELATMIADAWRFHRERSAGLG